MARRTPRYSRSASRARPARSAPRRGARRSVAPRRSVRSSGRRAGGASQTLRVVVTQQQPASTMLLSEAGRVMAENAKRAKF